MRMWWLLLDKDGGSKNFRVVQKGWQRIELIQGLRFYGSSGGKKYPASLVCSSLWFSRREAILIILMAVVSTIILFCCKRFLWILNAYKIMKRFIFDNYGPYFTIKYLNYTETQTIIFLYLGALRFKFLI